MKNNIYSYQKWKEFSLEQPDEKIYNYLRNVLDNTNLKGKLKHNNQNVFKVFSLIITHSYGHLVYEFTHFLYYLNKINIPYYKVIVSEPYEVQNLILNDSSYVKNNQIEFSISNKIFRISMKRIPILLIFFDFLEELLGTTEVIKLSDQLKNINNQKEINILSNNMSKLIYENIRYILPSAHIQSYGHLISSELMNFKNQKFDNLNSDDVDDDFIFVFWKKVNCDSKNISLKTFRLVFDLCLKYKKALELAPSIIQNEISFDSNENSLYQQKFYINDIENDNNWDTFNQNCETTTNYIVDKNSKSEEAINFFETLQNEGINLIKKNEIEDLKKISIYPEFLNKIALSYMRNIVFSNIQNKLIEAERRNNFKKIFEELKHEKHEFHYKNHLIKNQKFSLYLQKLKSIIFSYLWECNSKFSFNLINDYLSFEEKHLVKNYMNEIIKKGNLDLNNFIIVIKDFIEKSDDKKTKMFFEIKSKIKKFNAYRKVFRRKGLSKDDNSEIKENLFKASKFINRFIINIECFTESIIKHKELDDQFNKDFESFTNNFFLIHGDK